MSTSRSACCPGDKIFDLGHFRAALRSAGRGVWRCLVRHASAASHCSFGNSSRGLPTGPQSGPQTGGENRSSGRAASVQAPSPTISNRAVQDPKTAPACGTPRPLNLWGRFLPETRGGVLSGEPRPNMVSARHTEGLRQIKSPPCVFRRAVSQWATLAAH
jgi:hypothetical protein